MKAYSERVVWFVVGLCLGVVLGVGGMVISRQSRPVPIVISPPEPTAAPLLTATPSAVQVYVSGQVAAPDVYELPPDGRVEDAVTAAGGFTAQAQPALVNLAQPLFDGMQIYVPAEGEEASLPLPVATAPAGTSNSGDLVNINTAGLEELDTLPGIGPSTAQNIIDYRESNGPFETLEEIMDVPGIGEAKFNQIKDLITIH